MSITTRRLEAHEWQKYRNLRLEALRSEPLAFASSYEEEVDLSEKNWRDRMASMWFALVKNNLAGMVGLLRPENKAIFHYGYVVSLWVKPEYQSQGVAQALLGELQKRAGDLGVKKFSLEVTESQKAALGLYEKMGFKKIALIKDNLYKNNKYYDGYLMEWFRS